MLDSATIRILLKGEKQLTEVDPGLTATQHILHLVLKTFVNKDRNHDLWEVIKTEFENVFTLDDFLVSPKEGPNAGISGLLEALNALANNCPQAWDFIEEHFGEQLILAHFLTAPIEGRRAGKSGLWQALRAAADGQSQAWDFIEKHFSNQLTLAHFLTAPQEGLNARVSGLSQALSALAYNCPQVWGFISKHFGNELTLEHFLAAPQEGLNAGMSGLWLALRAAAYDQPQAWDFIEKHFGEQLTLAHFLTASKEGKEAGWSGFCWALKVEFKVDPRAFRRKMRMPENSPLQFLFNKRFCSQLKMEHIEQTVDCSLYDSPIPCSMLHLLCKTVSQEQNLIEYLGQILINNPDAVLKIGPIMSDKNVSSLVKLLLRMHQKIIKVKTDIATVKEDIITSRINDLINDAYQLQAEVQSVGMFLLAQCLFTNNSQTKERLHYLRRMHGRSIFAQEADFEQAKLLFNTDCDKDGEKLPPDIELKKRARKIAVKAALKLLTRDSIEAHLEESFNLLKRRIVAKLLGEDIPDNTDAFSWADSITKYSTLLLRIEQEKSKRQEEVIHKMQAQLDTLSSEITAMKAVVSTDSTANQLFMKKIVDLRRAPEVEKGPRTPEIFASESKRPGP